MLDVMSQIRPDLVSTLHGECTEWQVYICVTKIIKLETTPPNEVIDVLRLPRIVENTFG
jgi:hypothetical protein